MVSAATFCLRMIGASFRHFSALLRISRRFQQTSSGWWCLSAAIAAGGGLKLTRAHLNLRGGTITERRK
jgi:hypothetical protein